MIHGLQEQLIYGLSSSMRKFYFILMGIIVYCSCAKNSHADKNLNDIQIQHVLEVVTKYSLCRSDYFGNEEIDSLICYNLSLQVMGKDTILKVEAFKNFENYWGGLTDKMEFEIVSSSILSRKVGRILFNVYPDSLLRNYAISRWGLESIDIKKAEEVQSKNTFNYDPVFYTFKITGDTIVLVNQGLPNAPRTR